MPLKHIQERLQDIYEIDTGYAVSDFVFTDENIKQCLDETGNNVRETVYVQKRDDYLDISVYLHADVIDHLERDDPHAGLHSGNIDDFFLVAEGISHFIGLVWHGSYNRQVSLLELELQAEIDKFVLVNSFPDCHLSGEKTRQLHTLLFEAVEFHSDLNELEQKRYQDANFYAGKYCRALERTYLTKDDARLMLNELRRFYRLSLANKLHHINRLN